MAKKVNNLAEAMRRVGGKAFNNSISSLSYKTGFPVLDYKLGYMVRVYDEDDNIVDEYPALGLSAGSYVMLNGKPATGKTTIAIQIAANIVRKFNNGIVLHYDLEKALNYTRVQMLTKLPMSEIEAGKYQVIQEVVTLNDMKSAIIKVCLEKRNNPDIYKYDTGLKSEFNEPIITYEPTVVVIDSIPNLSSIATDVTAKKELDKAEEVSSQTDRMRLTAEVGRFYTELQGWCKEFNIMIISINQIKDKIQTGFIPTQSYTIYGGMDEALPGGKGPIYQTSAMLNFTAVGADKANKEDDGYDGYGIKAKIVKCRSNQAGVVVDLVYDKYTGVDSIRSSVRYAKNIGVLGGNKANHYFIVNGEERKDHRFTGRNMRADFNKDRELYGIMYEAILPSLKAELSAIEPEEIPEEEFIY